MQDKDTSSSAPVSFAPDAAKMAVAGRLAGGIAHDFNNILGAIEGYATLALRGLEPANPLIPDLEDIRKAVVQACAMTRQLQLFSLRRRVQTKTAGANSLIENLAEKARQIAGRGVRLELDLQAGLPDMPADTALLEQLLINLLTNAREAMPDGGAITVRTRSVRPAPQEIRSPDPGTAGPEFVVISVADTGTGIPPSAAGHLFEPFFTTKEKGRGAGLGLAVVYGIALQHNGWVSVKTAGGRGSEFSVFLPALAGGPQK